MSEKKPENEATRLGQKPDIYDYSSPNLPHEARFAQMKRSEGSKASDETLYRRVIYSALFWALALLLINLYGLREQLLLTEATEALHEALLQSPSFFFLIAGLFLTVWGLWKRSLWGYYLGIIAYLGCFYDYPRLGLFLLPAVLMQGLGIGLLRDLEKDRV